MLGLFVAFAYEWVLHTAQLVSILSCVYIPHVGLIVTAWRAAEVHPHYPFQSDCYYSQFSNKTSPPLTYGGNRKDDDSPCPRRRHPGYGDQGTIIAAQNPLSGPSSGAMQARRTLKKISILCCLRVRVPSRGESEHISQG